MTDGHREKLDACTTEEELLNTVDEILCYGWDLVSVPTPQQYAGGRVRGDRPEILDVFDVVQGRRTMAWISSREPRYHDQLIKTLESLDLCAQEEKTKDDNVFIAGEVFTIQGIVLLKVTKKDAPRLRASLSQRLVEENRAFEESLARSNAAPPVWFNRYLYHARIGILLGYHINDIMFFLHRFATDCPAFCAEQCKHT